MSKYLSVMYDENVRPYTDYPMKLAKHLFDKFNLKPGMKMLEPGVGRGEMLQNFKSLGLIPYGMDISDEAPSYLPEIPIEVGDIEKDGLPYSESPSKYL